MKTWILQNIDHAPPSLAMRMGVALRLLDSHPNYTPPIDQWKREMERHFSRSSGTDLSAACPPHATWCPRFGIPTDEAACAACTAAREDRTRDPETGLTRAALYTQQMRDKGRAYGAAMCIHRQETGEYREQRCCGGKVKQIPVVRCGRTGKEANCGGCRDKTLV